MKRVTIKDIAKEAGVSITAVSFVLNNKSGISEDTRKKVQEIIDKYNFKPNLNSKKLLFNKSFNIYLMINSFSSPFDDLFYFEITRGILNRSLKYNYNILIGKPIASQNNLPDAIYSGEADGIIFMQDITPALIDKAVELGVPFVVVDSHSSNKNITSISPDYRGATFDATTYLLNHGHQNIAMIASNVVSDFYEQTLNGFTSAMSEKALTPRPEFTNIFATSEDSAYIVAKKLLTSPDRPTAILCAVDSFAIGVIRCAKDLGLSVPRDISIIGIDDIVLSRYIEPNLTTMGIDKVGMGALAMDMLFQKIKGKNPNSVLLPMELVIRDSVYDLTK